MVLAKAEAKGDMRTMKINELECPKPFYSCFVMAKKNKKAIIKLKLKILKPLKNLMTLTERRQ